MSRAQKESCPVRSTYNVNVHSTHTNILWAHIQMMYGIESTFHIYKWSTFYTHKYSMGTHTKDVRNWICIPHLQMIYILHTQIFYTLECRSFVNVECRFNPHLQMIYKYSILYTYAWECVSCHTHMNESCPVRSSHHIHENGNHIRVRTDHVTRTNWVLSFTIYA